MSNHRREVIGDTQKCKACGNWKHLNDFHHNKRYANGHEATCKECIHLKRVEYYSTDEYRQEHKTWARSYRKTEKGIEVQRETSLKKHFKYKYGITYDQYLELVDKQNGKCAICLNEPPESKVACANGRTYTLRRLVVDHDHKTGIVRGLLCRTCNSLIGMAYDKQGILEKAIGYLNKP